MSADKARLKSTLLAQKDFNRMQKALLNYALGELLSKETYRAALGLDAKDVITSFKAATVMELDWLFTVLQQLMANGRWAATGQHLDNKTLQRQVRNLLLRSVRNGALAAVSHSAPGVKPELTVVQSNKKLPCRRCSRSRTVRRRSCRTSSATSTTSTPCRGARRCRRG